MYMGATYFGPDRVNVGPTSGCLEPQGLNIVTLKLPFGHDHAGIKKLLKGSLPRPTGTIRG